MAQTLGPYVLEAELGRGGMGVVWRAHDPALDRTVAIKVVLTAFAAPEELARFRREALAQARLRHPAIVGVHTVGATPTGQPYLVMDHVEGESLAQRLKREGPLAPSEAARIVGALARAVQYAHARGVLHRDLKARNVLIDAAGDPALIDFGLATLAGRERLTATGEVVGTPGCMSPEQAVGDRDRVGPKSDVYGLGALLHEALTGRAPFVGRDVLTTLSAVVDRPAEPPSRLRPGLDPGLDALVLRCLEKDPARRFPSADAVADALEAFAPRSGQRAPAPARRGGPGVALALLAVGLGGGALLARALPAGQAPAGTPADPVATTSPTTGGAAATARVASRDLAGARALADAALASPASVDLSLALLARANVRDADGDLERARADLDAAVALDRTPSLLAQRAMVRLLHGELAGAREDLAELRRSGDLGSLVFAARALALTDEPGALEAAEAAVAATEELQGGPAPSGRDRELRAGALGARAYARARQQLGGSEADVEAALAIEQEPLALLTVFARTPPGEQKAEQLAVAYQAAMARADPLAVSTVLVLRAGLTARDVVTAAQARAALVDLDKAAAIGPGVRRVLRARATMLMAQALLSAPDARPAAIDTALREAERWAEVSQDEPEAAELVAILRADRTFDPARGVDVDEGARAIAALTRGLARRPGHAQLLLARADLRASLGDMAGAEADAAAVVERMKPEAAPADLISSSRARAVLARVCWRRGAYDDALKLLDAAPPGPRPPHFLAERAVCLAQLREPARALADAQEAVRLAPRLARTHFALARAHLSGGNMKGALSALEAALQRDPGLAVALAERGTLRPEREGKEALADLEAALRLEPWAQEHRVALSMRLAAQRDQARADAELERALAEDPACCLGRAQRGRLRLGRDDARGALLDLAFVCERMPWSPEHWSHLAVARHALRDQEGALEAADRSHELLGPGATGPAASRAHRVRAAVLHDRRQDEAALEAAERALVAEPGDPDGLVVRAQLRSQAGDLDGALADLDEIIRRRPRLQSLRLDRAEVYLLRKEPTRAREELEALLLTLADPTLQRRAQALLEEARRLEDK